MDIVDETAPVTAAIDKVRNIWSSGMAASAESPSAVMLNISPSAVVSFQSKSGPWTTVRHNADKALVHDDKPSVLSSDLQQILPWLIQQCDDQLLVQRWVCLAWEGLATGMMVMLQSCGKKNNHSFYKSTALLGRTPLPAIG
jgi:hypothetical protein